MNRQLGSSDKAKTSSADKAEAGQWAMLIREHSDVKAMIQHTKSREREKSRDSLVEEQATAHSI